MKNTILTLSTLLAFGQAAAQAEPASGRFRIMTLDPGHFHAALVQKSMYADVDSKVYIFSPAGDDLNEHLKRIERFNTRADSPTSWKLETYTGTDFAAKAFSEKPGNLLVLSGNNAKKTDYILTAVQSGINVLADKPMAITPADFAKLKKAFEVAAAKKVMLYDIMTERYEITTMLQREFARQPGLFGQLVKGSVAEPAISKESVHHFSKMVAGAPLKRPMWFFDTRQQGEGIVDVTTHLVDLVQWGAFPEVTLKPSDAKVLQARRWTTRVDPSQFEKVTASKSYPDYLKRDVKNGALEVYANGEFTYALKGVHAKVSVIWNFEAPPGGGDTHYSIMRGTLANLIIKQGPEQKFRPTLYVEKVSKASDAEFEKALKASVAAVAKVFPGIDCTKLAKGWEITVPDKYHNGHEAHFTQVTEKYLQFLREGKMPSWEVPNMITKYSTIMQAYEMALKK